MTTQRKIAPLSRSDVAWLATSLFLVAQWIACHALRVPLSPTWEALLPGLGIFGAAFLLSWGAELAQLEISQALALAFLALVAVLPEYAVDMYLAWTAGKDPAYIQYAAANMTGSNRLLIGLGWPVVLGCYWFATRKSAIPIRAEERVDLSTLLLATLYAFLIPLKRTFSLADTVVLIGLFVVYIVQAGKTHHAEPELEGPPAHIATWPRSRRRLVTLALFLLPGYTIFIAAKPFADGLLQSARGWGVEEFLVIQWLAPLASESPEFIVAMLYALRRNPQAGFGTLISSKVNQWTLLIGMLPLVYAISAGHVAAMPLDGRQMEEIFLTASQSLLAVVMLANWRFGIREGLLLLALFTVQLMTPVTWIRVAVAVLYLAIVAGYLVPAASRHAVMNLLVRGWRSPRRPAS